MTSAKRGTLGALLPSAFFDLEIAAEIVYGSDLSGGNFLPSVDEALLKCPVLLLIPCLDEILEIFIVRYAQEDGRRNAGPLDQKALPLVGYAIEDLSEFVA